MLIAPLELHQYHILDDPKICCTAQIVIWTPSEQHDLRKWQLEATGCTEVYWALFLKVWLAGGPLPWWAQDQFGIFSTECFEVMCCQTTFEAMYKQHKFAYKWRRAEDTWTFSLTLQPTIGLPPVTYTYRIPRIFTPHRKLQSCHVITTWERTHGWWWCRGNDLPHFDPIVIPTVTGLSHSETCHRSFG